MSSGEAAAEVAPAPVEDTAETLSTTSLEDVSMNGEKRDGEDDVKSSVGDKDDKSVDEAESEDLGREAAATLPTEEPTLSVDETPVPIIAPAASDPEDPAPATGSPPSSSELPACTLSSSGGGSSSSSSSLLTADNLEEVLLELNRFERLFQASTTASSRSAASDGGCSSAGSPSTKPSKLPALLEGYLVFVAKGGSTHFPWSKVKWLFRAKLHTVIDEFKAFSPAEDIPQAPNVDPFDFEAVKDKVFHQLETFSSIPFTVQRLAELLTAPRRHYRRTDKFMRALEKNMLVVSTIDPKPHQMQPPPSHAEATSPFFGAASLLLETSKSKEASCPDAAEDSAGRNAAATSGNKILAVNGTDDPSSPSSSDAADHDSRGRDGGSDSSRIGHGNDGLLSSSSSSPPRAKRMKIDDDSGDEDVAKLGSATLSSSSPPAPSASRDDGKSAEIKAESSTMEVDPPQGDGDSDDLLSSTLLKDPPTVEPAEVTSSAKVAEGEAMSATEAEPKTNGEKEKGSRASDEVVEGGGSPCASPTSFDDQQEPSSSSDPGETSRTSDNASKMEGDSSSSTTTEQMAVEQQPLLGDIGSSEDNNSTEEATQCHAEPSVAEDGKGAEEMVDEVESSLNGKEGAFVEGQQHEIRNSITAEKETKVDSAIPAVAEAVVGEADESSSDMEVDVECTGMNNKQQIS